MIRENPRTLRDYDNAALSPASVDGRTKCKGCDTIGAMFRAPSLLQRPAAMAKVIGLLMSTAALVRAQCELLSWQQYGQTRHEFPYVLRLRNLLMFGSRHTRDPGDAQFARLEQLWREFAPEAAFSEGGIRPPVRNREDAIRRYGEPGLLRFLADRDHVTLRSLEPPEHAEAQALAEKFEAPHVKLFYFLRALSSSAADGGPMEARRSAALDSMRHRGLPGRPDSLREVDGYLAEALKLSDAAEVRAAWFDPTRTDTFLNDISRASSDYRNCHMLRLLIDTSRPGKRVFVVVGGSHVIVQEKALRSAFKVEPGTR